MNYIKKLQAENKALKEGLRRIKIYACSTKFAGDPYIEKGDIILRINEIEENLGRTRKC